MSGADRQSAAKAAVGHTIARDGERLVALSHRIHGHPELAFCEERAAAWCADDLEAAGFVVERGICELATSFRASVGSGPLTIGICCEYDALPGIGHACGHNVIAATAVGAGRALAPLADDLGLTVVVLGTPAEEGGGGKILMLERGGFDGLNGALMVHPWPSELLQMPCLAVTHFDVRYTGKEAHASAFPELGVNAADALTIAQVAIGLLRQHAHRGDQVHGIVTDGGDAPNIVPADSAAKYFVRGETLAALARWEPRIKACFEAGALASGASVEFVQHGSPYSEFRPDEAMAAVYRRNAEALGRHFPDSREKTMTASTDMANVSLAMPAIHPTLGLGSGSVVNHQAAFAAECISSTADAAVTDGAAAMAGTIVDLAEQPIERARLLGTTYRHG